MVSGVRIYTFDVYGQLIHRADRFHVRFYIIPNALERDTSLIEAYLRPDEKQFCYISVSEF